MDYFNTQNVGQQHIPSFIGIFVSLWYENFYVLDVNRKKLFDNNIHRDIQTWYVLANQSRKRIILHYFCFIVGSFGILSEYKISSNVMIKENLSIFFPFFLIKITVTFPNIVFARLCLIPSSLFIKSYNLYFCYSNPN